MPMPSRMLPRIADRAFGRSLQASQLATLRTVLCHLPLFSAPDAQTGGWDEVNASPRSEALSVARAMQVVYRTVAVPCRIRWDDAQDDDSGVPSGVVKEGTATLFLDPGYASFVVATQNDENAYLTVDGQTMKVTAGPLQQGFGLAGEVSFVCVQYSLSGGMSGDGAGGIG